MYDFSRKHEPQAWRPCLIFGSEARVKCAVVVVCVCCQRYRCSDRSPTNHTTWTWRRETRWLSTALPTQNQKLRSSGLRTANHWTVSQRTSKLVHISLSSWHALIERRCVHTGTRIFSRSCLLLRAWRIDIKQSQIKFNGYHCVVGFSWGSFPVRFGLTRDIFYLRIKFGDFFRFQTYDCGRQKLTRSSAIAEGPRDSPMLVNSCYISRGMEVKNVSNISKSDLQDQSRLLTMVSFDRPRMISY